FWLLRRFGGGRLGGGATSGRHPRLAVIDQATVDSRRRLVLIRRDNVEHLLIIGGPGDGGGEPNIVRAAAAPRGTGPPPRPCPPRCPRAPRGKPRLRPRAADAPPPGSPQRARARAATRLAALLDGLWRAPPLAPPARNGAPPRLQPAPPPAGSMADAAPKPA